MFNKKNYILFVDSNDVYKCCKEGCLPEGGYIVILDNLDKETAEKMTEYLNNINSHQSNNNDYVHEAVIKLLDENECPKPEIKEKSIYVISGEYPNLFIDEKYIVSEDNFNYCLKEKTTNNLSLKPKSSCFDKLLDAHNILFRLLQEEMSKPIRCNCTCTSKKNK